MFRAIWWIRRDLRLTDNQALQAAVAHAAEVLPVFILDDALWASEYTGPNRIAFLLQGLRTLDADLRARGSRLIVRQGHTFPVLQRLLAETDAEAIFAEEDYTPYARRRDTRIAAELPLNLVPGLTLRHPQAVRKLDGSAYTVFTPFSKRWKEYQHPLPEELVSAPEALQTPHEVSGLPIPADPAGAVVSDFRAGEGEARRRLSEFVDGSQPPVYRYREDRNRPGLPATSGLSPYLRFGMLSARQAVTAAYQAIHAAPNPQALASAETWLNELIWREFFQAILYHYPGVRQGSFRDNLQEIPWQNDLRDFEAWCAGQTGYPIVDAAMRQLAQTGWMHNRTRMIVASFLTKDLLINWQWGEKYFMQQLIDGDPAANNGGWQWSAGTGTDAAPYFRVFNPVLQSKKFDPDGSYIRRWVPELQAVPEKHIHAPWEMSADIQRRSDCRVGVDYPDPIVDHRWARERALEAYRQAKEQFENGLGMSTRAADLQPEGSL
jgi:deoxyribodipyrimidine photo-lyase